jgi:hypothetical protein
MNSNAVVEEFQPDSHIVGAEEQTPVQDVSAEGMEDNFVSSVLGTYFERFTAHVNNSHTTFLEHNQRLQAIKADIATLNAQVAASRRNLKKRMQNAVDMTDTLRYVLH